MVVSGRNDRFVHICWRRIFSKMVHGIQFFITDTGIQMRFLKSFNDLWNSSSVVL